jgi:hypothetical protein
MSGSEALNTFIKRLKAVGFLSPKIGDYQLGLKAFRQRNIPGKDWHLFLGKHE